jgi:hypothetical protein
VIAFVSRASLSIGVLFEEFFRVLHRLAGPDR